MQVVYQSSGVVDVWRPNPGLKKYAAAGLKSSVLDLSCLDWLFDISKREEKKISSTKKEVKESSIEP